MRTGIATVCLSGDARREARRGRPRRASTGSSCSRPTSIASPLSPDEVRLRAAELGLSIDLYQPFRDFEAVDPGRLERNLRRAEAKFDVMERLGAHDDARLLQRLARRDRRRRPRRRAAPRARRAGRRPRAADRLRGARLGPPRRRVRPRLAHRRGRRPPRARHLPRQLPHPVAAARRWTRSPRSRPRSSSSSSSPTRRTWSWTSCSGAGTTAASPARAASTCRLRDARPRRGLRRAALARGLQRRLPPGRPGPHGGRRDALAADPPGGARPAPRAAPAPPATDLDGYAFVELAIEPASVGETQRVLHALGCAPRAQHRTKPVTLWQQGTARVLLNAAAPQAAGVAAIAVESARPGGGRGARRGAARPDPVARPAGRARPTSPRSRRRTGRRSSSAAPTTVAAAAGARTSSPLEPLGATHEALVEGVDHVALAQPFDSFDEAVLFYRSVLGLEPRESLELAAPDGLVRSRAVTSADGSVRFALNVPVLAAGTGAATALQHVAFASRDALAAARAHGRARRPAARDRRATTTTTSPPGPGSTPA